MKEQQDNPPPSTRNLRFPFLFPLCTKRTIIHAETCFNSTMIYIVAVIICVPTYRVKIFLRLLQLPTGWTVRSDTTLCWWKHDSCAFINCRNTKALKGQMSRRYVVWICRCKCELEYLTRWFTLYFMNGFDQASPFTDYVVAPMMTWFSSLLH